MKIQSTVQPNERPSFEEWLMFIRRQVPEDHKLLRHKIALK